MAKATARLVARLHPENREGGRNTRRTRATVREESVGVPGIATGIPTLSLSQTLIYTGSQLRGQYSGADCSVCHTGRLTQRPASFGPVDGHDPSPAGLR